MSRILLEICVDTASGVEAAIAGGADRIELCSALAVGGLTPSAGLAATAVRAGRANGVAIRAMVRPRDGDFCYSPADLAVAKAEGAALLAQGVDGLVFGMTRERMLDAEALREWLAAMRAVRPEAGMTLHRAIDLVDDLPQAAMLAADLGFDCVLSSGGAVSAAEGAGALAAMQALAGERITIMPGSGITSGNVADLQRKTGARAIHGSASGPAPAEADPRVLALGFAQGTRRATRQDEVRSMRLALDRLGDAP